MTATISEQTKVTLPIVMAIVTAAVTGTAGVVYLSNKMDATDRRVARIERALGIEADVVETASNPFEAWAK